MPPPRNPEELWIALYEFFHLNHRAGANTRIAVGTIQNILQHGSRKIVMNVVENVEFTLGGQRFAWNELSREDQEIGQEIIHFTHRFLVSYSGQQFHPHPDEQTSENHFDQLVKAAMDATLGQLQSHGYDFQFGKPKSFFSHENVMKQLVSATIREGTAHADDHL